MKKHIIPFLVILFISAAGILYAQDNDQPDSLGLPGDNLNLYAVLDLFRQCATFDEFEQKLNSEDTKINNLDLNNDGKIDYISVTDHQDGDNHALVLQVAVNDKEMQDVAVIEIEKDRSGKYRLQIVGNEDLYGKDYIIEPRENDPGENVAAEPQPAGNETGHVTYVYVSDWPLIRFLFAPAYVVYVSPWHWYHYPGWWHPWEPWGWHHYYRHHHHLHHHYHGFFHETHVYRNPDIHHYYGPRRMTAPSVQQNRVEHRYDNTYRREVRPEGSNRQPVRNPVYRQPVREDRGNPRSDQGRRQQVEKQKTENPRPRISREPGDRGKVAPARNPNNPRPERNKASEKRESKPVKTDSKKESQDGSGRRK